MSSPRRVRRAERLDRLRALIERNQVFGQEEILDLLEAEGIRATQATLSRDLREIGARKGPEGYQLVVAPRDARVRRRGLTSDLRGRVTRCDRGGTLVVVRCRPGQADAVAEAFERAALTEVIGCIAGRDQVMVATASAGQARSMATLLAEVARPD